MNCHCCACVCDECESAVVRFRKLEAKLDLAKEALEEINNFCGDGLVVSELAQEALEKLKESKK